MHAAHDPMAVHPFRSALFAGLLLIPAACSDPPDADVALIVTGSARGPVYETAGHTVEVRGLELFFDGRVVATLAADDVVQVRTVDGVVTLEREGERIAVPE
ncbi:hypothetical protein Pla163_25360 [Planctomycetes bacterium Pla163]|uniref:Uncharacterized protein n=1 Tax=Rohdeia mirabilis TaxID=2528008 RepID=A0A518D1Q6_9BACT|nr:hypothetical protein Pla163_25360 [Planctomycetes bacterium Pla163]